VSSRMYPAYSYSKCCDNVIATFSDSARAAAKPNGRHYGVLKSLVQTRAVLSTTLPSPNCCSRPAFFSPLRTPSRMAPRMCLSY
jgi:hypothetical protein